MTVQLTLANIKTELCPDCNKSMQVFTIYKDTITHYCPTCIKLHRYTICLKCGGMFVEDEYKICKKCRVKSCLFLTYQKD